MRGGVGNRKLTAIDLFAGCGGLTVGLRKAGFRVIGAVEVEEKTAATYQLNHPRTHLWHDDIRSVKTKSVSQTLGVRKGTLDLLAGCPPCQGFSAMRTLNGKLSIKDKRNDLVSEFVRFVEELRPRAVMMENVPALASNRRFRQFCKRLAEIGYLGQYHILNAANFGVPQRRHRLIYLAGLGVELNFAKPRSKFKSVRDAINFLPAAGHSGDAVHDIPERHSENILELIKSIPKNGGGRTDLSGRRQLECHKRCDGFKDVYGRMEWDKLSPHDHEWFF